MIIRTILPGDSLLNSAGTKYDYSDSYQGTFTSKENTLKPSDIGRLFFTSAPKWVSQLFSLRNKISGLFGLKTSGSTVQRQNILNNFKGEPGNRVGLFKVLERSANEIILGEDDKHLNFRVSLLLGQPIDNGTERQLTISTTVVFNNGWGRLYFLPVRPFHKLIVPAMLKRIIRQLEDKDY